MGRAGGREREAIGGPAKSVVVLQIMRITSHGFSSVSAGSRYVKIYNVPTFGSTEAQLASVQLGRSLFHRQEAERALRKKLGKRSTNSQVPEYSKRPKYSRMLREYLSDVI
ncbi:Uncharacterized protein DBV15_02582 [Temnothorax longispinosus]|uniref:Uncharacterized protein n=1 Tax=Temnothorax longispinosus TaxID=300112 RepID=A0A4S2KC83_9HYME|nr:Uncharacterized protein DBV15_02582 [Temnothorax longispinosus]